MAALLVPFRDEIDNANLALILVLVVVVAAILGGRRAGALAAMTSTLAFDFFLTRPFLSARIESADDVETARSSSRSACWSARWRRAAAAPVASRKRAADAIFRVHRVADADRAGRCRSPTCSRRCAPSCCSCSASGTAGSSSRRSSGSCREMDRSGTVEGADHQWLDAGFTLADRRRGAPGARARSTGRTPGAPRGSRHRGIPRAARRGRRARRPARRGDGHRGSTPRWRGSPSVPTDDRQLCGRGTTDAMLPPGEVQSMLGA